MKPGSRALGIAESYVGDTSTLAGAVQTAEGRLDDLVFGRCTVGGTDVTDAIVDMADRLDRDDVRAVLVAGVALAWYNVLDLEALATAVDRPVVAVTFEASDGLEADIGAAFEGDRRRDRLERYRRLPDRRRLEVGGTALYVRNAGCSPSRAERIVAAHTPSDATRPEPLRVAKLAARALDGWDTEGAT